MAISLGDMGGRAAWLLAGALVALLSACTVHGQVPKAGSAAPGLVPQPQSLNPEQGRFTIGAGSRILCADPSLAPLGELLASEIARAYGVKPAVSAQGHAKPAAGDIVLRLTGAAAAGDSYVLRIAATATVEAPNLDGLYPGTITFLQTLRSDGPWVTAGAPAMTIRDTSPVAFRGLMIDIKNHWHEPAHLRQFIDLCRFYKIKYLSLHTGWDQWIAAVMESTAQIPQQDRIKARLYTPQEMDELIAYARLRGVYLIPHNETVPGAHDTMPALTKDWRAGDKFHDWVDEVDGTPGGATGGASGGAYTPAKDVDQDQRFWGFLRQVTHRSIRQFAAGFPQQSLPYYHIGPVLGEGGASPAQAVRILKIIQEVSPPTRMMFWNGPSATDPELTPHKDDMVVAFYTRQYSNATVEDYLTNGWTIVNCAWSPLYIVSQQVLRSQEQVFSDWNLYRTGTDGFTGQGIDYNTIEWTSFDKPQWTRQVIGGMLCTWEVPTYVHFDEVYPRLAALAEHAWRPTSWPYADGSYADFTQRYQANLQLLQRLTSGVVVEVHGPHGDGRFADKLIVTLRPAAVDTVVRYEKALRTPSANSPRYTEPLLYDGDKAQLTAQAFDAQGRPVGVPWTMELDRYPVRASIAQGAQPPGAPEAAAAVKTPFESSLPFKSQLTVTLSTTLPGTIHYTLDGATPNADWAAYTQPLTIADTATLKAALFDATGRPVGKPYVQRVIRTDAVPNLTLNKPVEVTSKGGAGRPDYAVDGIVDREKYWESHNGPQSLTLDLQQVTQLGRVDVYTYWDGGRYYQYLVEISPDKKQWTTVLDMSKNTTVATEHGYRHSFAPTPGTAPGGGRTGRYLRLTMLHNSANIGLHVVELRAFAPDAGKH
ncbi:MAG: chitobiase/beta-hexosaminidase C-terminal domain-containing protein [Phycisphaeraceae bacterium]